MPGIADMLNAAKVTLEKVTETAKAALSYIDIWDIAGKAKTAQGRFFKFAADWRKEKPQATWAEVSEEYYTASYWANQGKYLAMIDPDIPVPRSLSQVIARDSDHFITGQNYRYGVSVSITFGDRGNTRVFDIYVFNDQPLTQAAAGRRAYNQLISYFDDDSIPVSEGGNAVEWEHTESVQSFASYVRA
jgi:hypothetical protein